MARSRQWMRMKLAWSCGGCRCSTGAEPALPNPHSRLTAHLCVSSDNNLPSLTHSWLTIRKRCSAITHSLTNLLGALVFHSSLLTYLRTALFEWSIWQKKFVDCANFFPQFFLKISILLNVPTNGRIPWLGFCSPSLTEVECFAHKSAFWSETAITHVESLIHIFTWESCLVLLITAKEKFKPICFFSLFWTRLNYWLGTTQCAAAGVSAPKILWQQKICLQIFPYLIARGQSNITSVANLSWVFCWQLFQKNRSVINGLILVTVIEQEASCVVYNVCVLPLAFNCTIWVPCEWSIFLSTSWVGDLLGTLMLPNAFAFCSPFACTVWRLKTICCVTSCEAAIKKERSKGLAGLCKELWKGDGVGVRWFEDAGQRLGHGGALIFLTSSPSQWQLPFSSAMSAIRHPSGQGDVRKATHDIFWLDTKILGTK